MPTMVQRNNLRELVRIYEDLVEANPLDSQIVTTYAQLVSAWSIAEIADRLGANR